MNKKLFLILILLPFFGFSQKDTIAHLYTFGSVANDVGEDICATDDGGFAIIGSTASSGNGNTDIYLLKIDSLCNYQWSFALGGTNNDWGYAIKQTYDKGFIIAASSNSYGNGGYDAMLLKRDSLGNYQWQKTFGGNDWDFAYDVVQTFDSGYVFCGETYNNSAGFSDVYVVKTNSIGDTLWTKTIGGSLIDKGNAIIQTSDSNIVVAGIRNTLTDSTQAYVLKFDKDGVLLWDSLYGGVGYEWINDLIQTQDGMYTLTGFSTAIVAGDKDYYVIKVDLNGTLVWERFFSGIKDEEANAIVEIDNGDLWIVGYTEATGGGKKDSKIFRIDSNGWWANQNSTFGSFEDETATGIVLTVNGNIYLSGYTNSYGEGLNDLMVIRVDTIVKYQQFTITNNVDLAPISVQEFTRKEKLTKIYPNPTNKYITIELPQSPAVIQIVDLLGMIWITRELKQSLNKLDLSSLPSGIYVVNFKDNQGLISTEKLIILN